MSTTPFYDPITLILCMLALALLPFAIMMMTSFIKLVVVMNLLRQAMGLQQVPPNMVINGLAVVLTLYIMAPTLQDSTRRISESYSTLQALKEDPDHFRLPTHMEPLKAAGQNDVRWLSSILTSTQAGQTVSHAEELIAIAGYAKQPIVHFLHKHTPEKYRTFFIRIAKRLWPQAYVKNIRESDLLICVPAFVLSELTSAFEIGFIIYLPFIVIDLIVSNILLAMGMMMVSPMTISLPFKLMLFVLVNGWDKLIEALALTYR